MKITNVDDYIDKVAEKYNKIPKEVLKKVIEYGCACCGDRMGRSRPAW